MATHNFETALAHIFKVEGGYADHPKDPGGATNFGITRATLAAWRKSAVSKQDVQNLSRTEAAKIYRTLYWDKVAGDHLPDGVDLAVFDHAVHSGPARALRNLQGAINVPMDGIWGKVTETALKEYAPENVIRTLYERRLIMLKRLPTWGTFGKGWTRRLDSVRSAALKLCPASPEAEAPPDSEASMGKSFLASRTVWGALVALFAQFVLMTGYALSPDTQTAIIDTITQLVGLAGAGVALWGRVMASEKITR